MSRTEELRTKLARKFGKTVWHHFNRLRPDYPSTIAAYWAARRHVHFTETLKKDLATHKRRSRAAKKAWAKRKAA